MFPDPDPEALAKQALFAHDDDPDPADTTDIQLPVEEEPKPIKWREWL